MEYNCWVLLFSCVQERLSTSLFLYFDDVDDLVVSPDVEGLLLARLTPDCTDTALLLAE
jgi:hypothetical protein